MRDTFRGWMDRMRTYFQHFGRGFLLLVGVAAIAGLVIATFIYGDQRREQVQQEAGQSGQPTQSDKIEAADGSKSSQAADDQSNTNGSDRTSGEIANTGPAEQAGVIAAVLVALAWMHRRSSKQLRASHTKV